MMHLCTKVAKVVQRLREGQSMTIIAELTLCKNGIFKKLVFACRTTSRH